MPVAILNHFEDLLEHDFGCKGKAQLIRYTVPKISTGAKGEGGGNCLVVHEQGNSPHVVSVHKSAILVPDIFFG